MLRRPCGTLKFSWFYLFYQFLYISVQLTLASNFRVVYCAVLSFLITYLLCFVEAGGVNEFAKHGQVLPLIAFQPVLLWVELDCSKNALCDFVPTFLTCIHTYFHPSRKSSLPQSFQMLTYSQRICPLTDTLEQCVLFQSVSKLNSFYSIWNIFFLSSQKVEIYLFKFFFLLMVWNKPFILLSLPAVLKIRQFHITLDRNKIILPLPRLSSKN